MTHENQSEHETYRFMYLDDGKSDDRAVRTHTAPNDAEALKLAWKHIERDGFKSVPIEIWAGDRLVGRIDPPTW